MCQCRRVESIPFGHFVLTEQLAADRRGARVWRAHDTRMERAVLVRLLPVVMSDDKQLAAWFTGTLGAAARVTAPNLVPVTDFGLLDARLYVATEWIDGRDLRALLTDAQMAPPRALDIVTQVAATLDGAHRDGWTHGAVAPARILVTQTGRAYLDPVSIGARVREHAERLFGTDPSGPPIAPLRYMAPEALQSGPVPSSDVYSLACVLFACLTGSPPFAGGTVHDVVVAQRQPPRPRPSAVVPWLPTALDHVVAKALAVDPAARFATAGEMVDAAKLALTSY